MVVDDDGRPWESVGAGLDESGGAGHELEVGLADVHRHLTHLRVPAAEHVACTGMEHAQNKTLPNMHMMSAQRGEHFKARGEEIQVNTEGNLVRE